MIRLTLMIFIVLCSTASAVCHAGEDTESKVDYVAVLNKLSKQGRDESLNAAPYYRKATELYVELPEEIDYKEFLQWPTELPSSHLTLIRQWIQSNNDAMDQLRLGTQKPYYWNKFQGKSVWEADEDPGLKQMRFLAYAILFHGKLKAMEKGISKEASENILICIRFGSHLNQAHTLLEQLLGGGGVDNAAQTVFLCLAKTDPDRTAINLLQSSIHEELSRIQNQAFNVEMEHLKQLEAVQMLFEGTEDDSKLKAGEDMFFAAKFSDLTYEDLQSVRRGRTVRDIEAAFAYCKEFLTMSPWQAKEKELNFWEDLQKKTGRNPLVRFCMFDVPGFARIRARQGANRDALLTMLVLLQYRYDKGKLPKDLQELLVTDYLPQLPMDPYSDGPLVYKQTGDDFLLYSLGEDFDDDGGTHSNWGRDEQGGDYIFWPVQTKSYEEND